MNDDAHIRLTLTRGVKVTSGMDPRLNQSGPTLIVLAEHKPPVYAKTGLRWIPSKIRRPPPEILDPRIHHANLLNSILAKIEANNAGADDALMLDMRGFVAETNATHVFLVTENRVSTPRVVACPEGITRATVLEICEANAIACEERDLKVDDFYELFFEDAKEASGLLNLALTHRNSVPMCGMPYHAAQGYIAKLIQAGRRVAICDQTSEPQPGKIVTREITQIITAGTVSELDLLKANRPNYLGAVYFLEGVFGFAYAELSTGEFRLTQATSTSTLLDDLARISPAELLVSEQQQTQFGEIEGALPYDDFAFLTEHARFTLCEHFGVKSLDGFGCSEMPAAIGAAGAIIHYLKQQLRRKVSHLSSLRCDARDGYVMLDAATQVNLELVESRGARNTSLLAALDRTVTPMGGRKLRSWLLQPLRDLAELERRQQMIADLLHEPDLIAALRHSLKSIRDLERASGRLSQASGNARDLVALKTSLQQIPELKRELRRLIERTEFGKDPTDSPEGNSADSAARRPYQNQLERDLREMPELTQKLSEALLDDPPMALKEGGIFRDGFDIGLDELRQGSRDGKTWITELQEREIAETGIKSLK